MPDDDCLLEWKHSVRVSDSDDNETLEPGFYDIRRKVGGGFEGDYVIEGPPEVRVPLSDVDCKPGTKHHRLSFTRAEGAGKIAYNGKVVKTHDDVFVIMGGRYKATGIVIADDNGDWSSEKVGA